MITNNDVSYVIVQSGGKGTRLGHYTWNRPKCLIPVNDVPMIVNTLKVFQNKKVIIIGDHLFDILESYLNTFHSEYDYELIKTDEIGTAAGLQEAVNLIPENEPFILTWSDLFFQKQQEFKFGTSLLVGLSDTFKCRWRLKNNKFENIESSSEGVSGFFVFENKSKFNLIKTDKSLVRGFLSDHYSENEISSFYNHDCFEVGDIQKYEEILNNKVNHRYFNEVKIVEDKVYKKCVDENYASVFENEKNWYKFVENKFTRIPKLYSVDPLVLQKINGKHLWQVDENKKSIVENYCDTLNELHSLYSIKKFNNECKEVYYSKSISRVEEVKNIIKFIDQSVIIINGKKCLNPIVHIEQFETSLKDIFTLDEYNVIHGDPTFSNTLVDSNNQIWLIDPRGVFGSTLVYGDRRYDWAKLYYSAVGNYDSINSKKFKVNIIDSEVNLDIHDNGYQDYGDMIVERSEIEKQNLELIHASIWLSLTGYVKEDIDAVLFSFYKGCELWNNALGLI